jgi:hypothetical protein
MNIVMYFQLNKTKLRVNKPRDDYLDYSFGKGLTLVSQALVSELGTVLY